MRNETTSLHVRRIAGRVLRNGRGTRKDLLILAAGTGAAPQTYTIPNAQEILPKAVHAIIDGASASGSSCVEGDPSGAYHRRSPCAASGFGPIHGDHRARTHS